MKEQIAIFWFRRDLRLNDNTGLYNALQSGLKILPVFIFDTQILSKLENPSDRRVDYIHQAITSIKEELNLTGSDIFVKNGNPIEIWKELLETYNVKKVYCNHDYEVYGIKRDTGITEICKEKSIDFISFKDQCIFEKQEILSNSGTPYTVFTPYSRKWKEQLLPENYKDFETVKHYSEFIKGEKFSMPTLDNIGFSKTDIEFNIPQINKTIVSNYTENRDFPAIKGTSRISMGLRFGTISIRSCVRLALQTNQTWLNELIWRDFYMNILSNFPQISEDKSFKPAYDKIEWRNDEADFKKWCNGNTGFPIVDAGMRELNQTGFMHNRVRMIVASFLCKDLMIDWRWGQTYFAQKLNDFDFSANNGGWQWASGSGCDAAPYFRIFNPDSQTAKFDKKLEYIKKWIPELNSFDYPMPMVDHKMARDRALKLYKDGLAKG
jgi:deoxyribodipyrimidine photo-lyase